jgi:hypothetical protein
MNNFSNNSLLYYPTIEFQNRSWFKSSLTIWDKLYRIVPNGYYPKDSDEIKEAIDHGLIENIILQPEDLKEASDGFFSFLESLEFNPSGFSAEEYESRLHNDKLDYRMREFFKTRTKGYDNEGFYRLPSEVANGYMFFLAQSIAERRNIPKLTDNPDMFTAMSYFDAKGNFDELISATEGNEAYTTMTIETMIPADIPYLSITKIIEWNKHLTNMKRELRQELEKFMDEIKVIEDKKFALERVKEFKSTLMGKSATWTETLLKITDNIIPACIVSGFPAAISASIAMSTSNDPVTIGGVATAVYFSTMGIMTKSIDKVSTMWNSNNSNYYLRIRKELKSGRPSKITYPRWEAMLDEFVND